MAKNMMVMFLMCMVVVSTIQYCMADMTPEENAKIDAKVKNMYSQLPSLEPQFKSCLETCEKGCITKGSVDIPCHNKCDKDCMKKEVIGICSHENFYMVRNLCLVK